MAGCFDSWICNVCFENIGALLILLCMCVHLEGIPFPLAFCQERYKSLKKLLV